MKIRLTPASKFVTYFSLGLISMMALLEAFNARLIFCFLGGLIYSFFGIHHLSSIIEKAIEERQEEGQQQEA